MSQSPPPSQLAYVLHSRAYRETSALVDFLTPQGRLRAVLRSARGKAGTLARPFVALDVEFRGKGELKNVGRLESVGTSAWLNGDALFSGLYLNELLIRLLPAEDPHPAVFDHYAATLLALAEGVLWNPCCVRSNGACWMTSATVSTFTTTCTASPSPPMACTACKSTQAWSVSTCCNRACSRALSCWP